MTEAALTRKFLKRWAERYPMAVIFKHNDRTTSGIPDATITLEGSTLWLECKREDTPVTALQKLTMRRLDRASSGLAFFVVFARRTGAPTILNAHLERCAATSSIDEAIDFLFTVLFRRSPQ